MHERCRLREGPGLVSLHAVGRRSASSRTENQRRAFAAGHDGRHRPSVAGVLLASRRRGPVNRSTADLPLTNARARLPDTASSGGRWSLRRLKFRAGSGEGSLIDRAPRQVVPNQPVPPRVFRLGLALFVIAFVVALTPLPYAYP